MKKSFWIKDMSNSSSHKFYRKTLIPIKFAKTASNSLGIIPIPMYKKFRRLKDFKQNS